MSDKKQVAVQTMRVGGMLAPIHPQSIEEVHRLAKMGVMSGLLKPLKTGYGDKAQIEDTEATLARGCMLIMQGMEIGVPAMQSLQLLALIGNRIVAHSEAVPGIMLAHGFKIKRSMSGTRMTDDWTAHCEITRPDGSVHTGSFSVLQAKQARLWDQKPTKEAYGKVKPNDSAWFCYPERMLAARALGFASKDGAADVLKGIAMQEEVEDMMHVQSMRDVTPVASIAPPDIPDDDVVQPDAPSDVPDIPGDE
jgi:hypothetical protein